MRALRRLGGPRRLVDCGYCGRDFVIDNEQARRFDADLDRGVREIAWRLSRMRREGSPAG
jgi:hypothetical protein